MVAAKYVWLFKFKLNLKVSALVALAIFQVLNSQMWIVITLIDNAASEHFHYYRVLLGSIDLNYLSWYLFVTLNLL